jgi:tetratricopeptide (TPR) repeat protein
MKRLLFLCLVSISCSGNPTNEGSAMSIDYSQALQSNPTSSVVDGIQDKINEVFVQSITTRKDETITELAKSLEQLYLEKNQNLIQYWRSYLQFYASIFYFQTGDKKASEKAVDQGIKWLQEMSNKNSEDYALLSMLQGFALQFKGLKVMFLAGEVKTNAKQAIAIDSTNIRAYYVYASNDFYTPDKYGGGQDTEAYLLKAIELPEQTIPNTYLPSWGKQEAFELLIKLYIKREQWEQAKKYFADATKLYPESYQLNQLASKLVGK